MLAKKVFQEVGEFMGNKIADAVAKWNKKREEILNELRRAL